MADVPVINPQGEAVSIPEEQLEQAQQQGYVADPPEAQKARQQEEKFGMPSEMAKTAVEGAAEGIAGPLAPAAETYLGGENPEDIRSRAEVNPWTHGISKAVGMGVGFLTGTGLPGVVSKLGVASGLGTFGRAAVEMGILGAGDEASKAILQDPNQTASNAIAHIGLSSVLGGALGVGAEALINTFGKASEAIAGSKLSKWAGDVVDRLGYHIDNPNLGETLSDSLSKYYTDMKGLADSVRGGEGLKAQDISEALPYTTTKAMQDVMGDTIQHINGTIDKIAAEPAIYQGGAGKAFEAYRDRLLTSVSEDSSPRELFTALDQFKKNIGALKSWSPLSPQTEKPVSKLIGDVYSKVQEALENESAWGQAGKIQADVNEAWSKYIPALKDAEKSFTIPTADGDRIIDPGKMQTYLNQTSKLSGEVKRGRMSDFLEASEGFKSTIKDIYSRLGTEAPEMASPQALLETTRTLPGGAKFADALVKKGLAKLAGRAIGGAAGVVLGGGGATSAVEGILGSSILGPVFESLLPTIAKSMLSKEANGPALKAAVEYASSALKADSALTKGIKAIASGQVLNISDRFIKSSPEALEQLDKLVAEAQQSPDKLLNMGHNLSHYMSDHSATLVAQSANVINYLAQQRPHAVQQLPFDREFAANTTQASAWKRTLQIADKPLSVLDSIRSGRSTQQDVQDMQNMYPSMLKNIRDKLMTQVLDIKSNKEALPYSTRMHMSLFMGEPLDSSLTPQVAAAVQAIFAMAGGSAQGQNAPKRGSKGSPRALEKAPQSFATPLQARALEKQNKD